MSTRTLPLVFICLGGEMLYILEQRLRESDTCEDGSSRGLWTESDRRRVLNDVVGTMFSKTFMDELFKPQTLYSHRTMKTVITRLAHASIMRLNPASMDRLYELMVMAFKYQVFLCPRPKDLLLISHNHLDSIRDLVQDTPAVHNQVHETQRRLIETYTCLPPGELQLLRQTLLIFFQDYHIRVSLFLKSRIQNPNGRFVLGTTGPVPRGAEVPGLIRMLDCRGREVQRCQFPTGGAYTSAVREGSFDISGDRVLKLGTNIYTAANPEETHTSRAPSAKTECGPNPLAKEELNLLSRLMGTLVSESEPRPGPEKGFRINLFPSDREEDEADAGGGAEPSWGGVINIQAMKDVEAASELAQILGQFTEKEETSESQTCSKGDELLALMDELGSAASTERRHFSTPRAHHVITHTSGFISWILLREESRVVYIVISSIPHGPGGGRSGPSRRRGRRLQLHPRARHRGEQPGGAAAGRPGPRDHGGAAGREHGPGQGGERRRLHERATVGRPVQRPSREADRAAGPVHHRAQRQVRAHPGRDGHHRDDPGPAEPNPPRPKLRARRRRAQRVHQDQEMISVLMM